jgi:hypothetical protein
MTTFTPHSQHTNPPLPAPLDQPTPISPPTFMSNSHAHSNTMTTEKLTPPSSFGSRSILTTTAPTSQLTPSSSGAPNSANEDIEMEDSFGESNPHSNKRRRTYGSFDAERRSVPPNLRHIGNSTDGGVVSSSPSMQQIQELISNPDCSPYHLVCQKRLFPFPLLHFFRWIKVKKRGLTMHSARKIISGSERESFAALWTPSDS